MIAITIGAVADLAVRSPFPRVSPLFLIIPRRHDGPSGSDALRVGLLDRRCGSTTGEINRSCKPEAVRMIGVRVQREGSVRIGFCEPGRSLEQ
jgi:hypothetical protein